MYIIRKYSEGLIRHPLKVKMLTAFTIFSLGDIACQKLERSNAKEGKFDLIRTLK